jgi:hypothetical protein
VLITDVCQPDTASSIRQQEAWFKVHPKLVTQRLHIKLLLGAPASVLTSAICETRVCLQVRPTCTRESLGIKGAEPQALGNSEHPASLWQLHVDPCVLLREAAMQLFALIASVLGVESSGQEHDPAVAGVDEPQSDVQALLERHGVQVSASLPIDLDDMD